MSHAAHDPSLIRAAVDVALACGLLKRTEDDRVTHCPFVLDPCPVDARVVPRLVELTAPFSRLAHAVASDLDFLRQELSQVVVGDEYTRTLLELATTARSAQPWRFMLTRSDYFLLPGAPGAVPLIRQVELNTIAASYVALATKVNAFHRAWRQLHPSPGHLVETDPLSPMAKAMAQVAAHYDHPRGVVVMVVQPDERNVFDQRLLEMALAEHGVRVRRLSIAEIAERGRLQDGHLWVGDEVAAVTYFRAGYRPDELDSPITRAGRELVASSSTVAVPDLAVQLTGTKKIQQVLVQPKVLRRFAGDDTELLLSSFARMYTLDQPTSSAPGSAPAWRAAIADPAAFVLKPQREGGGFNFYDEAMAEHLTGLDARQREAYVLMERLRPMAHATTGLVDHEAWSGQAVSEIGCFGASFAKDGEMVFNLDAGHLVRTKRQGATEGGISAGSGHLDSLLSTDDPSTG